MLQKKILFNITEDWFFLSHFLSRALSARKNGFEIYDFDPAKDMHRVGELI